MRAARGGLQELATLDPQKLHAISEWARPFATSGSRTSPRI